MQLLNWLEFFQIFFSYQKLKITGLTIGKSFTFVCLCMGLNGFELSGWHCVIGYFFLNLPLLDRLFVVVAIIVLLLVLLLLLCVSSTTFQRALAEDRNINNISLI